MSSMLLKSISPATLRSGVVRSSARAFSATTLKHVGLSDVKYVAKAKSVGGRAGKAHLIDASPGLNVDLALPKSLGGSGTGHNPEQLFSLGYSACFLGAMGLVAKGHNIKLAPEISVETHTTIGTPTGGSGFGLGLKVIVRGEGSDISQYDLEKVVKSAHEECPYSKATRGNIDVDFDIKA